MRRLVLTFILSVTAFPACGSDGVPGRGDSGRDAIVSDLVLRLDAARETAAAPADPSDGDTRDVFFEAGFPTDDGDDPLGCIADKDCASRLASTCRAWACSDGECRSVPVSDGSPCDDGDACTDGETCLHGACKGNPIACPAGKDPCVTAACDPALGCGFLPVTGAACDDANACTGTDRCILGACLGEPVDCADGEPCTRDDCDPGSGCVHVPLSGGACDDGNACTRDDACHSGACEGIPNDCDDANPCTKDGCDPGSGCSHVAKIGTPCDDGTVCTTGDFCDAGVCAGTPISCVDGNPCTLDECHPVAGCLHPPSAGTPCNDGNPCTDDDRCIDGLCTGQATACDDGNPCTVDGCTFLSGCTHQERYGLPCDDGNACTENDRCDQGACRAGEARDCEDGNACTKDYCEPASGCGHSLLDKIACDDADACTESDACTVGVCAGNLRNCDDAEPCTSDACDPQSGCVHVPREGPCDDGDPCTEGDACQGGECAPGKNPQCLAVKRVVLAGDSWSAGLLFPLRDALDARGYEEVPITWELTAKPGTTVAQWVSDPTFLADLWISLDVDPPADILFFTLSGNDYLHACKGGLGLAGPVEWFWVMAGIQSDLQTFVSLARAGRPGLKVVLIGYDYLNYFLIQAFGKDFPGLDWIRFNLGMVELANRGRAVAASFPGIVYAHNMGLMQHTFGDPAFGYGPGKAPKPGPAPGYVPFPGGWYTYPSPAGHIPDGIHPDYAGFRAIIENTLDQGPAAWIEGKAWP